MGPLPRGLGPKEAHVWEGILVRGWLQGWAPLGGPSGPSAEAAGVSRSVIVRSMPMRSGKHSVGSGGGLARFSGRAKRWSLTCSRLEKGGSRRRCLFVGSSTWSSLVEETGKIWKDAIMM